MLLAKTPNKRIYFGIDSKDIARFHNEDYRSYVYHGIDTISVILKSVNLKEVDKVLMYCRKIKKMCGENIKIIIYTLSPSLEFNSTMRKICKKYKFRCWTGGYYRFIHGSNVYNIFRKDHFEYAGTCINIQADKFCGYTMNYQDHFFAEDGFNDLNYTSIGVYSELNPIYKENYKLFKNNCALKTARCNAANVFARYAARVAKELEKKYL